MCLSFRSGDDFAPAAEQARDALEAAGIPCRLATEKIDQDADRTPPPEYEYRLLVPGKLIMPAASVLDKEIFNADIEAEWRTYFDSLSDQELRAVDANVVFAGIVDRLERATRAYKETLKERGIAAK